MKLQLAQSLFLIKVLMMIVNVVGGRASKERGGRATEKVGRAGEAAAGAGTILIIVFFILFKPLAFPRTCVLLSSNFQERLEQERKEKKKQKEKERKERLKKEGKLLTKAQKEARARAEATLKMLQAQGEHLYMFIPDDVTVQICLHFRVKSFLTCFLYFLYFH